MASNELTNQPIDNFTAAAGGTVSAIVGERLRFTKGRYLVGKGDLDVLDPATTFHVLDVQAGWVKFVGGQPVDQKIGLPMVERWELDDNDPNEWPLGFDSQPQDPWSNQRYIYLLDPKTATDYTFITSSWGGRKAWEQLCRQVANMRAGHPGAIAVIKPEIGYNQSQRYGQIPSPKFTIVGWAGTGGPSIATVTPAQEEFGFAGARGGLSNVTRLRQGATRGEKGEFFDDSIPF
jgi:hypothetical protein